MVKRVRKPRTRRRPFRKSGYSRARRIKRKYRRSTFNKTITGVPARLFIKVRKDIPFYMSSTYATPSSFNALICGGMQSANLNCLGYFAGSSVTPLDTAIDLTGSTGLTQWFSFYDSYFVRSSKIKLEYLDNTDSPHGPPGCMVTVVPTVGYTLANQPGSIQFDTSQVDPGELPYAKRKMTNGVAANGGNRIVITNYCSIKKMLAVKDLQDVLGQVVPGANNPEPYVPTIDNVSSPGNTTQPFATPAGVYWNIVFQSVAQNQATAPTPAAGDMPVGSCRIQITSYIEFRNRKVLASFY